MSSREHNSFVVCSAERVVAADRLMNSTGLKTTFEPRFERTTGETLIGGHSGCFKLPEVLGSTGDSIAVEH